MALKKALVIDREEWQHIAEWEDLACYSPHRGLKRAIGYGTEKEKSL